jgi:hypothetical protein
VQFGRELRGGSRACGRSWVHRTLKTGVRLIDQEADVNIEQRHYVQMAEIEIDPAQFEPYRAAVTETAVRVEPGVLVLYAISEKDSPRA